MTTPLWRSRPTAFEMLPATTVRRKAINDFIYLSEGNSNAYLIVTREGRVVINTGMGFEAPVHKEYFDSIDAGPVRYIVLTQGHVDHVGGVDLFREPGTEVVAQANNAAQQAYDARLAPFRARRSYFAFAESFERMRGAARGGAPPVQSRPTPTITFEDRYAFDARRRALRADRLSPAPRPRTRCWSGCRSSASASPATSSARSSGTSRTWSRSAATATATRSATSRRSIG